MSEVASQLEENQVRLTRNNNGYWYAKTCLGNEIDVTCWQLNHTVLLRVGDVLEGTFWGNGRSASRPSPSHDLYFYASAKVK